MTGQVDSTRIPEPIRKRLRLPLIVAPMFGVSGPALVEAACDAGAIGAFPTINARSARELDAWLDRLGAHGARSEGKAAPWCANVVMRDPRAAEHLECLRRTPPEIAIASVGSPRAMITALRDKGTLVFADVATLHHASKAVADGADGLVLLSSGAGGNTGWLNPFAFVRAVRAFWDGPIALAGGVIDGVALRAMETLGCDFGYSGTRFIAASESLAGDGYRAMLKSSTMDDIMLTRAFTGLDTNMLKPSIEAAGLDPATLPFHVSETEARLAYSSTDGPQRWKDIWSAGHTVSGVSAVSSTREIIENILEGYNAAGRSATGQGAR